MRHFTWSLLAAGLILAGSGTSQAQDTIRLGGSAAQNDIDGGADISFVRGGYGGGRGGYGGGYRGGYGYGRGYGGYGYGRGYYGYGRGYGYGYGLGYGYGYYPSYWYGYSPAPVYYYSQPSIYYSSPSYYYPIAGTSAPVMTTQGTSSYSERLPSPGGIAPMRPAGKGTFPYDGGPLSPVPMPGPGDEFSPAKQKQKTVPIDGKLVSLPNTATMGSFLLMMPDAQPQRNATTTPTPGTGYAAYGEDPVASPVRKR